MVLELVNQITLNETQDIYKGEFLIRDIFGADEITAINQFLVNRGKRKIGRRLENTSHKPRVCTYKELQRFAHIFKQHAQENSWWRWRTIDTETPLGSAYIKTRDILNKYTDISQPVRRVNFRFLYKQQRRAQELKLKSGEIILKDILPNQLDRQVVIKTMRAYKIKLETRSNKVITTSQSLAKYKERAKLLIDTGNNRQAKSHQRILEKLKGIA